MNQHVICIQDLSCFGKCSLTISLPVLSSAGLSVTPLPTVLLSTHTGGLGKPHLLDLSDSMREIRHHWQELKLPVSAVYSGYVSDVGQVAEISKFFDEYPKALHLVDPVLGDHGHLYASLHEELITEMRSLCKRADVVTPNMTEAYALLQEPYREGPYEKTEIYRLVKQLYEMTHAMVILSGVWLEEAYLGCAIYDAHKPPQIQVLKRLPYRFHGTGDLFAASFLGAYLHHKEAMDACVIAMRFTTACMEYSHQKHTDERYGLLFEPLLSYYIDLLEEE